MDFFQRRRIPVVLAACWCLAACAPTGTEETRWEIRREPEVAIGKARGDDPYLFQSIRAAGFLPDGRIAVADAGQLVVRIFSADGTFETELGGPGEGPGEFRRIAGLWLTPAGSMGVWDPGNRRISFFSADGSLLSTESVTEGDESHPQGSLDAHLGTFDDGTVVLAALSFGDMREDADSRESVQPDRWTLVRYGTDGAYIGSLGEVVGMRRTNRNPLFSSPVPYTAILRDSLLVADGYEAEISVRDWEGVQRRTIRLPGTARSEQAGWDALEAALQRSERTLFLEQLARGAVPRSGRFPEIGGLLVDDEGLIWAKVYDPAFDAIVLKSGSALRPGPGGTWHVLRPSGEVLAVVQMPETLCPMEIRGGKVIGVSLDSLGVETVAVHRLEGADSG